MCVIDDLNEVSGRGRWVGGRQDSAEEDRSSIDIFRGEFGLFSLFIFLWLVEINTTGRHGTHADTAS